MKTLEEIKKQVEIKLGFSCVGSQILYAEELAKEYYKDKVKNDIEKAFNAGQRYGVYLQGGSYDKGDDVDFEDYLKEIYNEE